MGFKIVWSNLQQQKINKGSQERPFEVERRIAVQVYFVIVAFKAVTGFDISREL